MPAAHDKKEGNTGLTGMHELVLGDELAQLIA
jgi:hypothetical protein